MKTFLIATDFSAASRNAELYGLQLANAMNAKAVLISVYQVPLPAPGVMVMVTQDDMKQMTEDHLQEEAAKVNPYGSFLFETISAHGLPSKIIAEKAAEMGAELIIAGMKGGGKTMRQIFGSTVSDLAKNTKVPLLVVPEGAAFAKPDSIVLATDLSGDTDMHALDELKIISDFFHSRLFVVRVVKDKSEEWQQVLNTPETLKMAVRKLESQFEYPVDRDITHGLNEFTAKHGINLIAMIPHKHSWAEKLLSKSETKDMLYHTHVPLLLLPDKKYSDLFMSRMADNAPDTSL